MEVKILKYKSHPDWATAYVRFEIMVKNKGEVFILDYDENFKRNLGDYFKFPKKVWRKILKTSKNLKINQSKFLQYNF